MSVPPPLPRLSFVQAWDNIVGQNPTFVRNTGMGAMGAAGAVGLVAMFTEFKK